MPIQTIKTNSDSLAFAALQRSELLNGSADYSLMVVTLMVFDPSMLLSLLIY